MIEKPIFILGLKPVNCLQNYMTFLPFFSRGDILIIKPHKMCIKIEMKHFYFTKKMGLKRKLESKDEFLMMLIKLKLDVLLEDPETDLKYQRLIVGVFMTPG